MRRYVLATDPGKTTGWAWLDTDTNEFKCGQEDFDGMRVILTEMVDAHGDDLHIVTEQFIMSPQTIRNTQAPWSLEMIGVCRYFAREYTDEDVTVQGRSSAKRFASSDRLKNLGWYVPGKGHSQDAARHLLLFLVSRGWKSDLLVIE